MDNSVLINTLNDMVFVKPRLTIYSFNLQPAIWLCHDDEHIDDEYAVIFGTLTVNLEDEECDWDLATQTSPGLPEGWFRQYIDVNNLPGIEDILKDVDWCRRAPSGKTAKSGYVTYPLYEFNSKMIEFESGLMDFIKEKTS